MFSIFTALLNWKGTWLVQIFGFQYFQVQKSENGSDSQLVCARVLESMMYIINCVRLDVVCY